MTNKNVVSDLLFKLLLISDKPEEANINDENIHLVIPISSNVNIKENLNPSGKITRKVEQSIQILDVNATLESGQCMFQSIFFDIIEEFKNKTKPVDSAPFAIEIATLNSIVLSNINTLTQQLQSLGSTLSVIRNININNDDKQVVENDLNVIIGNESTGLVHLVLNDVQGNKVKIKKSDAEKIGAVINEVMLNYLNTNLDESENVRKLKAELDYKIIEALPNQVRTQDLNINMDVIINEIKEQQKHIYGDDKDNTPDVNENNN